MKATLSRCLHVPDNQMTLLLDKSATRDAIISAFRRLIYDPTIRNGDTIIIFYAGHGSRVEAPSDWPSADGKIETICPHDERATDGHNNFIHGIPDRTINWMLHQLAAAKGNNITVIFDCCHSGGITRQSADVTYRSVETSRPIPATLDEDIWGSNLTRAAEVVIPPGFRYKFMSSHVLLAACRQEEKSRESTSSDGLPCGFFTNGLVTQLRQINLSEVTYAQLLELLPTAKDQHPQCEGTNKNRLLFDNKVPPVDQNSFEVTQRAVGEFEVPVGSIHGVVNGTKFQVRHHTLDTAIFLVAVSVDVSSAVLNPLHKDQASTLPMGAKVVIFDWNNSEVMIKVFLPPLSGVSQFLFPGPNNKVDFLKRRFVKVDSPDNADVVLARKLNGEFDIERRDSMIPEHCKTHVQFKMDNDRLYWLPSIVDAIAHFNFFLRKRWRNDLLEGQLALEMYRLAGEPGAFMPDTSLGNMFVGGMAKFKVKESALYGFAIINRSPCDLFPYLFYFDPSSYSIEAWYIPPSRSMAPPLRAQNETSPVTVGYGAGGGFPFAFTFHENETSDSGFVKLFVSTTYVDLDWVTQLCPFNFADSTRVIPWMELEIPILGSLKAVITLSRGS